MTETAQALAKSKEPNAIWVENNPDAVVGYVNSINRSSNIKVEIAEDLEKFEKVNSELSSSAYVFDIKLEERIDGITLANRIRRTNKIVPIRFVSSYLDQYKDRLQKVNNVAGIHNRLELEDEKFEEFTNDLVNDAMAYQVFSNYSVAQMSWDEFLVHPHQKEIVYSHAHLFTRIAKSIMRNRKWAWVAISGDREISGSEEMNNFPTLKEKEELTNKHGGLAFVYSRPIISEEGNSSLLLNCYPKIQMEVDGYKTLADFDTGTNQTLISDRISKTEPLSVPQSSRHFGQKYEYFINQKELLFVSCENSDHSVGPVRMPVAIVQNWHGTNSPWIRINPKREALIGRDIFTVDTIAIHIISNAELSVSTTIKKHQK